MNPGERNMNIIEKVHAANRDRRMELFARRLLKLGEEYGEASQAYLSVSSEKNGKDKSWADVREELVDVLVVTLDLLCHQFPDDHEQMNLDDKILMIHREMDRKLKKWAKKQVDGKDQSI
jgi:NTP pyrophosphatase (non-canonical NTP hydrolase)